MSEINDAARSPWKDDEKLLDVKIYEELNLTKNSLTIPGMKITTKIRLLLKLISIWIGIVKNKLLN